MKTEYFGPFHIIQKILKKNVAIMSSFWNWNWNWNWNGITRNGTWNGTEIENGTGTGSDRPKKVERFMPCVVARFFSVCGYGTCAVEFWGILLHFFRAGQAFPNFFGVPTFFSVREEQKSVTGGGGD